MYDFPELARAHERLRDRFHARMSAGVGSGDVELTQICGYPLITSFSGAYAVVGAPVYDLPLSRPSVHRGLVVVASDSPYETIEDLRGTRFAYNALDSNTGTNLPRRLFAPLSVNGRFFSETLETGSHLASLAAVTIGNAAAASIDSVTFALLAAHRPVALAGVRVLAMTATSPLPPFVTPAPADPATIERLFAALSAAIDDVRDERGDEGFYIASLARATSADYVSLALLEREAAVFGYERLA
jgi:ABC-type phosphate/phosphonate transport system substrate-binding protein